MFSECACNLLETQNISDLHTERMSMLEEKHFEISKPMTLYSLKNVKGENYVYGIFFILTICICSVQMISYISITILFDPSRACGEAR